MVAIKLIFVFFILTTTTLVTAFNSKLMLKLVNDERKKVGVSPLSLNSKLMSAAQKHTNYMVKINKLTHEDPRGTLKVRVKAEGYSLISVGENIAEGFGTNEEARVMQKWMGSSLHRKNILNKNFIDFGVGFGGGKYWTQVFARPASKNNKRSIRKSSDQE
ncbi:CAP domain-containing protein [Rhizophagus diaphanus]|nr:CAP domain-containing protein [Rhizophagus diaphanus] [Rhizophagus sp. MUCL 43196]